MADYYRKLNMGRWLMKTIIAVGMLAGIFAYTAGKSITMNDIVTTLAKVPLSLVLMIEAMDKFSDKRDYIRMYAWMYKKLGGTGQGSSLQSILAPALVSAIIFFGMLVLVGGTLTLSLGAYTPALILVSGMFATYAMLPETGDDELILWIWLAAQVATGFRYLTFLPGQLQALSYILTIISTG